MTTNTSVNTMPEFHFVYFLDKLNIFEVYYIKLKGNKVPYFSTQAARFVSSKRDYSQCGQAQEHVLPHNSKAYQFYKKWDHLHLKMPLTQKEYDSIENDIIELICSANRKGQCMLKVSDCEIKPFSFHQLAYHSTNDLGVKR